jgi:hypothetical protein
MPFLMLFWNAYSDDVAPGWSWDILGVVVSTNMPGLRQNYSAILS